MLKESIKYDQVKELALAEENDEHIIKDEIIKLLTYALGHPRLMSNNFNNISCSLFLINSLVYFDFE